MFSGDFSESPRALGNTVDVRLVVVGNPRALYTSICWDSKEQAVHTQIIMDHGSVNKFSMRPLCEDDIGDGSHLDTRTHRTGTGLASPPFLCFYRFKPYQLQ
ncbi:hypothetical protein STEG23_017779, partial [Scotinomys teguina]